MVLYWLRNLAEALNQSSQCIWSHGHLSGDNEIVRHTTANPCSTKHCRGLPRNTSSTVRFHSGISRNPLLYVVFVASYDSRVSRGCFMAHKAPNSIHSLAQVLALIFELTQELRFLAFWCTERWILWKSVKICSSVLSRKKCWHQYF